MLAELGGIPVGALTPAALLGVVILLIAMGRLVPRRTMEDIIHDRNEWRAAHRISEQSRMELASMVGELLEHARTTDAFIRSIPHPHGPPPPFVPGAVPGPPGPPVGGPAAQGPATDA